MTTGEEIKISSGRKKRIGKQQRLVRMLAKNPVEILYPLSVRTELSYTVPTCKHHVHRIREKGTR